MTSSGPFRSERHRCMIDHAEWVQGPFVSFSSSLFIKFFWYMKLCPRASSLMSGLSLCKLVDGSLTHIFSPNNFPELQDSSFKCLLDVSSLSHRLIKHNIFKTEFIIFPSNILVFPGHLFNQWDPSVTKDRNLRIIFYSLPFTLSSNWWWNSFGFLFVWLVGFGGFCFEKYQCKFFFLWLVEFPSEAI